MLGECLNLGNIKKLNPVTLIVGASSEIAQEVAERMLGKEIILVTRKLPDFFQGYTSNKKFHYIEHDLENEPVRYSDIKKILNDDSFVENLIYLSSFQTGRMSLVDMNKEDIAKTFNVNIVWCTLLIAELLRFRPLLPGSFVLFGSQAAVFGGDKISAYAASKAAVETLVKGLARELAECQIRINAISLGVVKTKRLKDQKDFDEKAMASSLPFNRLGTAKEVSNLVMWLLGDESSYISGSVIAVTGGR